MAEEPKENEEAKQAKSDDDATNKNIAKFVHAQSDGTRTLDDIEKEIDENYKRMMNQIDELMGPLRGTNMDSALVNSLIDDAKNNARKDFYNVLLSNERDISEIEKISTENAYSGVREALMAVDKSDFEPEEEQSITDIAHEIAMQFDSKEELFNIEELSTRLDQESISFFENAHKENATTEEKNISGALIYKDLYETLLSNVNYDELSDEDKDEVLTFLKILSKGENATEETKKYVETFSKKYGIPEEEIEKETLNAYDDNTFSKEDFEIEKQIQKFVGMLKSDIQYKKDFPIEEYKQALQGEKGYLLMDAFVKYTKNIFSEETKNQIFESEKMQQLVKEVFIPGLDQYPQESIDIYFITNNLEFVKGLNKYNPDLSKKMLEAINSRLSVKINMDVLESKISIDELENTENVDDFVKNVNKKIKEQEQNQEKNQEKNQEQNQEQNQNQNQNQNQEQNQEQNQKQNQNQNQEQNHDQDQDQKTDQDSKPKISDEQKKENIEKGIRKIAKAKGIEFTIEKFIIPNGKKDSLFYDSALNVLEEQKDSIDFKRPEMAKKTQELFMEIIEKGDATPEIYEKMTAIDLDASKEVLKQILEKQKTYDRTIDGLGRAIKERAQSKTKVLKPDKIPDELKPNLFDKKKNSNDRSNNDSGPTDRDIDDDEGR